MKKESSISPAIQNAQMDMGPGSSIDKEEVFKQMFSDMAFKSFSGKFPYLMEYILNFKVLNTDVDKGYAVGTFFLQFPGSNDMLSAPVLLQNNSIQPIMFIYSKEMDLFLPLTQDWMEEFLKKTEERSGEVVKPDLPSLQRNTAITAVSNQPNVTGLNGLINKLGSFEMSTTDLVSALTKEGKQKFKDILDSNEKIAQYYLSTYEIDAIKESFKYAEEAVIEEGSIEVANPDTPIDVIKKEFGKDHVVMDDIATRGYHVKDTRETDNKLVVYTEHLNTLENPTESGVYEVYLSSGKLEHAVILQDPIMVDSNYYGSCGPYVPEKNRYKTYQVIAKNKALVLFPSGNYTIMKNDNIMASPTLNESMAGSPVYDAIYGDKTTPIPIDKPFIFVKRSGAGYVTTGPIRVKTKVDEGGAIKCTTNYGETSIIYSSEYRGKSIYVTKNGTMFVPDTFKVVLLKDEVPEGAVLGSMKTIITMMNSKLLDSGGKPLTIVKDDQDMYGVESARPVMKSKAIVKVAEEYNVNAKEIERVLDNLDDVGGRVVSMYVLPKTASLKDVVNETLEKEAQMPMGPGMEGMIPPAAPMMDPMMMQGGQMPPMQPPVDPVALLEQGAEMAQQLGTSDLFDASALMSLSYISQLEDLFPKYLPNLITALDNISRLILNFWMNSEELQEEMGLTEYVNIETKLKTLHSNLSDLLLTLNKKIDIFAYK